MTPNMSPQIRVKAIIELDVPCAVYIVLSDRQEIANTGYKFGCLSCDKLFHNAKQKLIGDTSEAA